MAGIHLMIETLKLETAQNKTWIPIKYQKRKKVGCSPEHADQTSYPPEHIWVIATHNLDPSLSLLELDQYDYW